MNKIIYILIFALAACNHVTTNKKNKDDNIMQDSVVVMDTSSYRYYQVNPPVDLETIHNDLKEISKKLDQLLQKRDTLEIIDRDKETGELTIKGYIFPRKKLSHE